MKVFQVLFAVIPLGIGLTVLGFLWGSPFNEFGSPPLFFRIFGSFIALGFVLTGLAAIYSAAHGLDFESLAKSAMRPGSRDQGRGDLAGGQPSRGYQCGNCGAALGQAADVSPHGDVKCDHCGKWFNIHATSS